LPQKRTKLLRYFCLDFPIEQEYHASLVSFPEKINKESQPGNLEVFVRASVRLSACGQDGVAMQNG
jgi:hypothetical protein